MSEGRGLTVFPPPEESVEMLKDEEMRRLLSETNSESILSGISTPNLTN